MFIVTEYAALNEKPIQKTIVSMFLMQACYCLHISLKITQTTTTTTKQRW